MLIVVRFFFFFFSSRRRHTRCREVSWARRCVQETEVNFSVQALPLSLATTYGISVDSVSYTHLTLPTILLVQISVVAVSLKKKKKQRLRLHKTTNKTNKKMSHLSCYRRARWTSILAINRR
eukprot:TRINITY_DN8792_c0_g1_i9.p2 TRINITY_DN8792_c0_g1~~TRINITY_DN8792_c0_g1_i9.p2  ORF type:complete len:122 (-),score=42.10 TRINITY_DN8792_c0_g1_i9:13-378(-)